MVLDKSTGLTPTPGGFIFEHVGGAVDFEIGRLREMQYYHKGSLRRPNFENAGGSRLSVSSINKREQ
jgi:hypothetical protein